MRDLFMNKVIVLKVINSEVLESGVLSLATFNPDGGTIGSGTKCDWILKDRSGWIPETCCLIISKDNSFCIEDLCDFVFINGSSESLGHGNMAILNTNDVIAIGPYQIRISIGEEADIETLVSQDLIHKPERQQDTLLHTGFVEVIDESTRAESTVNIDDPILALDNSLVQGERNNVLPEGSRNGEAEAISMIPSLPFTQVQNETGEADTDFDLCSAANVGISVTQEEGKLMNISEGVGHDSGSNNLLAEWDGQGEGHLAATPLMRGLGVTLEKAGDVNALQAVSMDIGSAMQAAIRGILALHENANNSRYHLINKNLQPIEDNPLRLGLSYEETVRVLFDDDKSQVHLSPDAAIKESLTTIQQHNLAVNKAISEALEHILESFSPDVLEGRFKKYRKSSELSLKPEGNWTWQMYVKYYEELTSMRQQGFNKLFWEVFEQVYDKNIRQQQRMG